jgi:hypothetical protein
MVQRRMLDELLDQKRTVLHEAEHRAFSPKKSVVRDRPKT